MMISVNKGRSCRRCRFWKDLVLLPCSERDFESSPIVRLFAAYLLLEQKNMLRKKLGSSLVYI